MRHHQLLLVPRPKRARQRHRWEWYPDRNECGRSGRLVYSSDPRAWLAAALGSDCHGPLRSAVIRAARAAGQLSAGQRARW